MYRPGAFHLWSHRMHARCDPCDPNSHGSTARQFARWSKTSFPTSWHRAWTSCHPCRPSKGSSDDHVVRRGSWLTDAPVRHNITRSRMAGPRIRHITLANIAVSEASACWHLVRPVCDRPGKRRENVGERHKRGNATIPAVSGSGAGLPMRASALGLGVFLRKRRA